MRVLITRPRQDAIDFAEALQARGIQAFYLPTIHIQPLADPTALDRALSRLGCYHWMVLTSAHAVDVVLERLSALGITQLPAGLKVAAVGPKTAERLKTAGILPDHVPDEYLAEAILPGLGDLAGRWVLLPTADIAHDTLPRAIQAADGIAHVITAYRTLPAEPDPQGMAAVRDGLDWITFTSGSTARNFVSILRREGLDPFHLTGEPRIACIGPKTAHVAQEEGFQVDLIAETFTVEGLVQAIESQWSKRASL
jgi:uroporphyrinogen III methyltransferase / synthase